MAFIPLNEYPYFIEERDLNAARSICVPVTVQEEKERVACIGSGPASLACAAELRSKGYAVTIFEERCEAGGSLRLFLPEGEVEKIIASLKKTVSNLFCPALFQRIFPSTTLNAWRSEPSFWERDCKLPCARKKSIRT